MTFQAQRFFSLSTTTNPSSASAVAGAPVFSSSSNNSSTTTAPAATAATTLSEQGKLDLLVRASATNKMSWHNNKNSNCVPSLGGGGGERPNNNNEALTPGSNPQNARLYSASQSDLAPIGGGFNINNNLNASMNLKTLEQLQPQLGSLFGNNNVHSTPQVSAAGMASQAQWNNSNNNNNNTADTNSANLAAQVNAQANVISQLVASLQAQQQAQLQVALSRAFGPGVNSNTAAAVAAAATTQGAGDQLGIQGLSSNLNSHSMMVDSMGGMGSLQQENTARDLFSRVQFAQRVQQQQQQQQQVVQQQQQQQAAQLVHQMQQQQQLNSPFVATPFDVTKVGNAAAAAAMVAFHPNTAATMNVATLAAAATAAAAASAPSQASAAGAAAVATTTTADELMKMRFEHERQNRILRAIHQQAEQQDARTILSNHGAQLMTKTHSDITNGGAASGPGISNETQACMNDAINTIFLHQQQHSNASFPQTMLASTSGSAAQKISAATLSMAGLNQQGFENSLQAAVGMPSLAGLVGNVVNLTGEGGQNAAAAAAATPKLFGATSYGATIVPCRARGMPVDHNFKTAFFVIPENCEHGDELMCTYPSCRSAGVKFRYCLHCKVPVAKRNFRNRHRHGVMEDCSDEEDDSEEDDNEEEEGGRRLAKEPVVPQVGGAAAGVDEDEDYTGVKKEHILIIPGVDHDNNPSASDPMTKKKKKKGKVRVPCRARGLPMAHNFKSAYFIIPPTIEHGDELLCSFPLCRSAGAKFRYCLHCKVPVAKRNFRNRHKHGKNITVKSGTENANEDDDMQDREETHDDEDFHPEDEAKLAGSSMKPSGDVVFPPPLENAKGIAAVRSLTESSTVSSASFRSMDEDNNGKSNSRPVVVDSASKVTVSSSHDATEVQKWVEMLENKPDPEDKQAMAIWMANLMNATKGTVGRREAIPATMVASPATTAEKMPPAAGRLEVGEKIATEDESSDLTNDRVKKEFGGGDVENMDDADDIASSLIGLGQPFKNDTSY